MEVEGPGKKDPPYRPPPPLRDTRNLAWRRISLTVLGAVALVLFLVNLVNLAALALALLSAAAELELIERLRALLSDENWFVQILDWLKASLGDIASAALERFRETVRPLFGWLEALFGYPLPGLVLDLLAAITAQIAGSFVAAFRRHIKKRRIVIGNLEGAGGMMARLAEVDRREMERSGLRLVLGRSIRFFVIRVLVLATLTFLVLAAERNWEMIAPLLETVGTLIG